MKCAPVPGIEGDLRPRRVIARRPAWLVLAAGAALAACELTSTGARPVITNQPPATATEDVPYAHQALSSDADGPSATWSLAADHTCGGTIDPDTGRFTFTPAGPVPKPSCVVAVRVCDGSELNWCAIQSTVVSIVATDDPPTITSRAPGRAWENEPLTYQAVATDPDGGVATWSLGAEHTCGGAIGAATGLLSFTPGDASPPTCELAIEVCAGDPALPCAAQRSTVEIILNNDGPTIDSTAPTVVDEGAVYPYAASATDPDGPEAHWSLDQGHTCGGAIDEATGAFAFTAPRGAAPPQCRVSVRICDGGAPSMCARQSAAVSITAIDDPPIALPDTVLVMEPPAPVTIDVLANDSDPDVGPRSIASVTQPAHGAVVATAISVTYRPDAGFCTAALGMPDTFTYTVAPGGAVATVTVWVRCPTTGLTRFATGDAHSCEIRTNGTLWCWGANVEGQLGDGSNLARSVPTQIGAATDWATVDAGTIHTCATRTDGTLWCWGQGDGGQLGDGTTLDRPAPVQVGSASNWAVVAGGDAHTCAIRTDGTLWCWGWNGRGQLGNGSTVFSPAPVQVGTDTAWANLAAGNSRTCAFKHDRWLYCWGDGINPGPAYLGYATTPNVFSGAVAALSMGPGAICRIATDGGLVCGGPNSGAETAPPPRLWTTVAAGAAHNCATRIDGSLWCWGANDRGQLGIGAATAAQPPTRVGPAFGWLEVWAGGAHTCARRVDGTRWCWGANGSGQLGDGTTVDRYLPTQLVP